MYYTFSDIDIGDNLASIFKKYKLSQKIGTLKIYQQQYILIHI